MAKPNRKPRPSAADGKSNRPSESKRPPRPKKTIAELAAEQGVSLDPKEQLERILKHGKNVFRSDEECEQFVTDIYERRRQGREA